MLDFFGFFRPNVELNSGLLDKAKIIAAKDGDLYDRYLVKCGDMSWNNLSKIDNSIKYLSNINFHQQKTIILLFLLPVFWYVLFYIESLIPGGLVGFKFFVTILSAAYLLKLYADCDDYKFKLEYYINFLNDDLTDF